MLPYLAEILGPLFGPARLFGSMLFLIGFGSALCCVLTFMALPRLWYRLPTDQGRAFAVDADKSVGKPVSAGLIFVPIFVICTLIVSPLSWSIILVGICMIGLTVFGFYDARLGFSEAALGFIDLIFSILGAVAVCELANFTIWLPFVTSTFEVPAYLFIIAGAIVIWVSINATNCTDGVDGLSGSLSALALVSLGGFLYGVLGHEEISNYLLVPHYANGSTWSLLAFLMVGSLSAYLWFNSFPSRVLMGDAGSRPIGFLIGVLVLTTGNPFLLIVVAGVLLANGATGLLKLGLARFFDIRIFRDIRYPLHDHMRHNLGWSTTQVLMRFMILQAILTPTILVLLIKIR